MIISAFPIYILIYFVDRKVVERIYKNANFILINHNYKVIIYESSGNEKKIYKNYTNYNN